jgi:hypothetical protein
MKTCVLHPPKVLYKQFDLHNARQCGMYSCFVARVEVGSLLICVLCIIFLSAARDETHADWSMVTPKTHPDHKSDMYLRILMYLHWEWGSEVSRITGMDIIVFMQW